MFAPLRRLAHRLTPRPLRRSIGARVLAGFVLTALLAVLVAAVSLAYSTDAGRGLARVTERDREVSADLRNLEAAVEQQAGAVQNFLLSTDDRDLEALNAGRTRFTTALASLAERFGSGERADALADLRKQAQAFDDVAAEDIALSRQGWGRSANFLWRTDGVQRKQDLLTAVQRQVEIHNTSIDEEIAGSREHLRFAYALSLTLVAIAAGLAFMVGIAITRAVTRPVHNLMQMAAAVRGGDYTVRAPVTGEDELAVLSLTMNAMMHSLAASHADIERALAETERSEEKYRLLTENASDIIYALDRDARIVFINPAVRAILGYEPDELLGKSAATLLSDDSRLAMEHRGAMERPDGRLSADVELKARDGRIVPMGINSSAMSMGGTIIGVQGIARDMTERHRMEQELRRLHTQGQRRVDQLLTLNEVGRKIAALQPIDSLLPHLAKTLGRIFGYHHVRILLVGDGGALSTAAAWHQAHAQVNGMPLTDHAPDDDLDTAGEVSPLALRAIEGDAGFVAGSGRPEDDAATRYTEVAVAVRARSGVLGVLDVRSAAEGLLDESDIFTLQTLADQVAVAIENARLYEAGQRLAVSEERNRLARDLHDSVTQELFSMTMIAGALPALIERKPPAAKERAQRLYDLSRGALSEMRALLFALRPVALAEEGLVSALTKHAAAFENQVGIVAHFACPREARLSLAYEEALYRISQEALNNVTKHAKAQNVWITLDIGDSETILTVRDDGAGFDPATVGNVGGMGMTNMRERVEALGGALHVESAPGLGTTLHVTVPAGAVQLISA